MFKFNRVRNSQSINVTIYHLRTQNNVQVIRNVSVDQIVNKLKRKSDQGLIQAALRYADKQLAKGQPINFLYYDRQNVGVEISCADWRTAA
jgi:hypothetical protein